MRGTPSTKATMFTPKVVCSWVCLYSLLRTIFGFSARLSSMTSRMPDLSDSSRRSAISLSRPFWTCSTIFCIRPLPSPRPSPL